MLYVFKYCQKISNLKRKWLQKIDGENFYVFYAASNDAFGLLAKFCEKKTEGTKHLCGGKFSCGPR